MTLVELLASMMVASIIMVALLQTLTSASVSWTQQSKHFSAQREGRVAMRILADDLAAMVVVPQWARATVITAPVSPNGTHGEGLNDQRTGYRIDLARGTQDSARVMFLRATAAKGDTGHPIRGDLCLVMYGLALVDDNGASGLTSMAKSQKLVRRVLTPEETFRRLKRHLESAMPMVTNADWEALQEMRFEPGIADSGVVAHDVTRFDLRPLADVRSASAPSTIPDWQPSKWMDVTLRVTNRQTGQHLETEAEWRGAGEQGQLLLNGTSEVYHDDPEVKTYTMRLRLPSFML